jgi:curli biogenesis system outer membrane secretion channel CsgG
MNKKVFFILAFVLTILFFGGCAKKVQVRALEPAEVDRLSQTKRVAVLNFKNDKVGLSRKIESKLAAFTINGKKYFTVVGRNDLDAVLRELKLQSSGLVKEKTALRVGELIGADAIISGDVQKPTKEDTYFYEQRVRCADKKCKELVYYKVRCMKRIVGLAAEIRIVDVAHGDLIFGDTLNKHSIFKHCNDDSRVIPSTAIAAQSLAEAIARDFTYKLTPHYRTFYVRLLDSADIDYTDEQKKLLEVALEYIEQGRLDKAEKFLLRLIDATHERSYVAFYNMGVIKEAQGKYQEAKEYYDHADALMIEPVDEINEAVGRIERLIQKQKQSLKQIES